jgi:hypothetical protein
VTVWTLSVKKLYIFAGFAIKSVDAFLSFFLQCVNFFAGKCGTIENYSLTLRQIWSRTTKIKHKR